MNIDPEDMIYILKNANLLTKTPEIMDKFADLMEGEFEFVAKNSNLLPNPLQIKIMKDIVKLNECIDAINDDITKATIILSMKGVENEEKR